MCVLGSFQDETILGALGTKTDKDIFTCMAEGVNGQKREKFLWFSEKDLMEGRVS